MASLVAFGLTAIGAIAFGLATPSPQPNNQADRSGRHEHPADDDSGSDVGF